MLCLTPSGMSTTLFHPRNLVTPIFLPICPTVDPIDNFNFCSNMSISAFANVMGQALSVAQLSSALWSSIDDAETALKDFSAAQGWSLVTRKSEKYKYQCTNAKGEQQIREIESYKLWICSKGHGRQVNDSHRCTEHTGAAAASAEASNERKPCEEINSSGQLGDPPINATRLSASTKTGCPVSIGVRMQRNTPPADGSGWTESYTPCAGYRLYTSAKMLLPCHHNHTSNRSAPGSRSLTESVSQIPDHVREEVKEMVVASFPSYRIRNFIAQKHKLPTLTPSVWTSLIRSIKIELGICNLGYTAKYISCVCEGGTRKFSSSLT